MGKVCEKQNDLAECHVAITPNQMLCEEGMERIQYFQKYGKYASIFLSKRNMNTRTQAYRKKIEVSSYHFATVSCRGWEAKDSDSAARCQVHNLFLFYKESNPETYSQECY